jgi:transcriptional regulator with XRE-family HTH domain
MSFRENLKAELTYSGMLVKELAAQTGLKKHSIDNYLSVRGRMPAADVAVRIARALGVSVEYLVTGDETPGNKNASCFSPEVRLMARIAEQLRPEYRKIALSLIESLKKHDLPTTRSDAASSRNRAT